MAQGNSGTITVTGTKNMSAVLYWSETYNATANTHIVSIDNIKFKSTNWYGFTYYLQGSITIDGTTVFSCTSTAGSHYVRIDSQNTEYPIIAASGYSSPPWTSGTITGNADGTKSVTIAFNFYGYTTDGRGANAFNTATSSTVALFTIPRKSSVSMGAATMGSASTITITRASSSFTHTLTYAFGNATGTITTKTTATSVSWTPALTLANQIPNSASGTVTITCSTYNGSTLIGSTTCTATLSVPASVKPTFTSLTATRIDGDVPSSWGIYVQRKSKATLSISGAVGSYGSTISAYSIAGGGYSATANTLTTGFLTTSGSITFTGKVMDSRGRWSAEQTVTISVVAYSPPNFSSYTVQRCNSTGTITANGTYGKGTAVFTYASCSGKNTVTTATYYKKTTATSYTNAGVSFSSGTAFVFGGGNLSVDYTYDIRYTVTDAFGTATINMTLSTAAVLLDFKSGGTGLAVGKVSEYDDCFEVSDSWDVRVYGMLLENYIRSKASGGIAFAACETAEATAAKVATLTTGTFTKATGAVIAVKFTNSNSVSQPTLNVAGTGAAYMVSYANYVPSTYAWKSGQTVLFLFDGTYYVALYTSTATTGYYGVTKLSNSVASTSTALAATANAVKTAYDRNSWDSITLTNPLAIAYGGTGAATAAAARTNLGIGATCLFSGTVTTGSCSFNYSNYKFFIIIGQVSSTASRLAIVVPKEAITTSSTAFQIADESYYYSFNLYYSGSTGYLAYKGRNSTGQILYVYGVN